MKIKDEINSPTGSMWMAKGFGIVLLIGLLGFIVHPGIQKTPKDVLMVAGAAVVVFLAPSAIYIPAFISKYRARKRRDEIIAKGQKIIGEIVDIVTYGVDREGFGGTHYAYEYEFESPQLHERMHFTTPSLAGKPQIKKSDLPRKVIVYYYDNEAVATEIID